MNDIGHNRGPIDEADALRERLAEEHAAITKRANELLDALTRLPEVRDDEAAGKVSDYIKLVAACHKEAEGRRVSAKEPFLQSGRAIDGWFKQITDALAGAKTEASRPLTRYLTEKEAVRRREAEEQARLAREESERKAREAAILEQQGAKVAAAAALDTAVASADEAAKLSQAAAAKPAEFARTRGDYGSVATLRQRWVGEITDRAALDLEALRPYIAPEALEKAINLAIKAGVRELRGARIFQQADAAIR